MITGGLMSQEQQRCISLSNLKESQCFLKTEEICFQKVFILNRLIGVRAVQHPFRQIGANSWKLSLHLLCLQAFRWVSCQRRQVLIKLFRSSERETEIKWNSFCIWSDLFTDTSCVTRLQHLFVQPGSDIQHPQYALRSKQNQPRSVTLHALF